MTSRATGFSFASAAILGLVATIANGESEVSYKAWYDLQINIGAVSRSVKSRVHVTDGNAIPIEIGDYRAGIKISSTGPGFYNAHFELMEDVNGTWVRSNLASVSFSGVDGEAVWFQWRILEIDVKLEFLASGARQ